MSFNLRNRSFVKEIDFEPRELRFLLQLSESLKIAKYSGTEVARLAGKEIALIFEKTSTRTRSAFEVAAFDQGAHITYLDPSGSQLGHKESIADTARVLGRMYDAIEFRGNTQDEVEELARHAGIPVYNGLTAEWHPTLNHPLTPNDVVPGSETKVYWQCTLAPSHIWQTTVASRTASKGAQCVRDG